MCIISQFNGDFQPPSATALSDSSLWDTVMPFVDGLVSKIRARARKYALLSCYEEDDFVQSGYIVAYELLAQHGFLSDAFFWTAFRGYIWENLVTVPRNTDAGRDGDDYAEPILHITDEAILALVASNETTPEDILIEAEESRSTELPADIDDSIVDAALETLSERQREAYVLRMDGMSLHAAAAECGIRYQSIQARERSGVNTLRRRISRKLDKINKRGPVLPFYGEHTATILAL